MPSCPMCYKMVSWKWHQKYKFCSEGCRTSFIQEFTKTKHKIPNEYGDTKAKRNYWRRIHEKYNKS